VINKDALFEDLIKSFCRYQYRLENPFPTEHESFEMLITKYRSDIYFKMKVDNLAYGVMQIIDKHI